MSVATRSAGARACTYTVSSARRSRRAASDPVSETATLGAATTPFATSGWLSLQNETADVGATRHTARGNHSARVSRDQRRERQDVAIPFISRGSRRRRAEANASRAPSDASTVRTTRVGAMRSPLLSFSGEGHRLEAKRRCERSTSSILTSSPQSTSGGSRPSTSAGSSERRTPSCHISSQKYRSAGERSAASADKASDHAFTTVGLGAPASRAAAKSRRHASFVAAANASAIVEASATATTSILLNFNISQTTGERGGARSQYAFCTRETLFIQRVARSLQYADDRSRRS
mmetsp:Transcript_3797/g.11779  ORF Transcript_3797/g.11779 Transcript_3797/m.11779 type:complete len:292 (+) Transcript_3797:1740-2615(+)